MMDSSSEHPNTIFPGLRSWWWATAALSIFATTTAAGMAAKSFGPLAPELGLDIFLSHGRNSALTALSEAIHYGLGPAGALALVLMICGYLLWYRRRPVQALAFGSVVAVGWLAATAGKILVSRSRPPADATGALIAETGNNSFPSGHTAFAVSLALAAVLVLAHGTGQRLTVLAAGSLFATVVAFSRMYLGVHYLSDVIGSVLISSAAILAWLPVWNKVIAPRISGIGLIRGFDAKTLDRRRRHRTSNHAG
ncbi:MAG: phosphatase PAP2 family protein [Arthrobacter sp.]|uniref:phosphatase PAP2 family protein n=1 Tax=unclassified Arthrobacter TaxID=235627 RepID=UPI001CFF5AA9|nr:MULTISPECIES: phosphatase PAP2 family protein [unclassified Arthrobacter]WGZ80754.1 phosphatase PAP2 family protein [Arthrobacter sp. EM1]